MAMMVRWQWGWEKDKKHHNNTKDENARIISPPSTILTRMPLISQQTVPDPLHSPPPPVLPLAISTTTNTSTTRLTFMVVSEAHVHETLGRGEIFCLIALKQHHWEVLDEGEETCLCHTLATSLGIDAACKPQSPLLCLLPQGISQYM